MCPIPNPILTTIVEFLNYLLLKNVSEISIKKVATNLSLRKFINGLAIKKNFINLASRKFTKNLGIRKFSKNDFSGFFWRLAIFVIYTKLSNFQIFIFSKLCLKICHFPQISGTMNLWNFHKNEILAKY